MQRRATMSSSTSVSPAISTSAMRASAHKSRKALLVFCFRRRRTRCGRSRPTWVVRAIEKSMGTESGRTLSPNISIGLLLKCLGEGSSLKEHLVMNSSRHSENATHPSQRRSDGRWSARSAKTGTKKTKAKKNVRAKNCVSFEFVSCFVLSFYVLFFIKKTLFC